MNRIIQFSFLVLSALAALSLSALAAAPVLADGGSAPPAGLPAPARSPTAASGSHLQIPAGARLVVLDGQGNKVPLGSQAAQQILASSDPIWCPSSVALPVAGVGGCSPAIYNTDLATLFDAVENNHWTPIATNSTIWVKGGDDTSTVPSVLQGALIPSLKTYTLTIQGGWTGSGHLVDPYHPTRLIGSGTNVEIDVSGWQNTVTVNDFVIINSGGNGINIQSSKNIVLKDIQVLGTGGAGIYLDASTGSGVTFTNGIVRGSNQAHAAFYGLEILSKGPVTLTNITAENNLYSGAYVDTSDYGSAGVTLKGAEFDGNQGNGLQVTSKGTIISGALDADNNSGYGVTLDNHLAGSALPVTLSGASDFSGNTGGDGLDVYSKGAITINNLAANYNSGNGAELHSSYSSTTPSAVRLTGTSSFDNNTAYGLAVSSDGPVFLNNISADYDGVSAGHDAGLMVDNSGAGTPQAITLSGTNTLNYNGKYGGDLEGTGAISVNNLTAECNGYNTGDCHTGGTGGIGLYLRNQIGPGATKPQAVTMTGTNNVSLNDGDNLDVGTFGGVNISNLTADSSATGKGADLEFSGITGAVTLSGVNSFNSNQGMGLDIYSNGAIKVSNVSASGSKSADGADLSNPTSTAGVILTGAATFDGNYSNGLKVYTKGAITAANLEASGNTHGDGADLDNQLGTANVTLTGTNTFDWNYSNGMDIESRGAVTTNNLTASSNATGPYTADGVIINNSNATAAQKVTLNGVNVFNHNSEGLSISSHGQVVTNNITANYNNGSGAAISSLTNVSLNGTNAFLADSGGQGLWVWTNGTVNLNHVTIGQAYGNGLKASGNGKYVVNCGSFINNGIRGGFGYGWETDSSVASITLIGTNYAGNYTGPWNTDSGSTATYFPSNTCTLP